MGAFSYHNFIIFSCSKILLDYCFAHVINFLFFLFLDIDLKSGLPLFLFWFRKFCGLGCFHAHYSKCKINVFFHVLCAINPMGSSSRLKMIKNSKKTFESFMKYDFFKKIIVKILISQHNREFKYFSLQVVHVWDLKRPNGTSCILHEMKR